MLDQTQLKAKVHYDPETGKFLWRKKGALVGTKGRDEIGVLKGDRLYIHFGEEFYSANRLAWLYVYGSWPIRVLQYINNLPLDNRIANLTESRGKSPAVENLTRDVLAQHLDYCEDTGVFTWKLKEKGMRSRVLPGAEAGLMDKKGYIQIGLMGKKRAAHRLAWLWVYGEEPLGILDHVDTIKHHNWISNLRLSDATHNNCNRGKQGNNTTGFKGVSRAGSKFSANIKYRGVSRYLGNYDTAEEAHAAYCRAGVELHGPHFNSGVAF